MRVCDLRIREWMREVRLRGKGIPSETGVWKEGVGMRDRRADETGDKKSKFEKA